MVRGRYFRKIFSSGGMNKILARGETPIFSYCGDGGVPPVGKTLIFRLLLFKVCVCYFLSFFLFFIKWWPFKNYEKCFLVNLKSSFSSRDIQIFVFSSSPLFFVVNHCFRGWFQENRKVYDVIICLNKNLIASFLWYLEKEISVTLTLCPLMAY